MIRDKTTQKQLRRVTSLLKIAEVFALCSFILSIFWKYYANYCIVQHCNQTPFLIHTWATHPVFIGFFAIIFFTRTGIAFALSDPDDRSEPLFYLSLFGLTTNYIFISLFFEEMIQARTHQLANSAPFFIVMSIFFATALSLLIDKATWDKTSYFVRLRIALAMIHIISIIISPFIGILVTIPMLILAIFWKDNSFNSALLTKDNE